MTKTTLKQATNKINMILCNNAPMVDKTLDNSFNQYFLTDLSLNDYNYYKDKYPELEFIYSEGLDLFVFCTNELSDWDDVEIESIDLF